VNHRVLVACLLAPISVSAQERFGPEFRVNVETSLYQTHASVAMNADGNFVVAWRGWEYLGSGGPATIDWRRFDASGTAVGLEGRIPLGGLTNPDVLPVTSVALGPT
jgi:hypothetical protein